MQRFFWIVLTMLSWSGRAEAKCLLPQLTLVWSYPVTGAVDVPTNAELWVVVPWAWWNPVARLDGREIAYAMSPDARSVVHLIPDALEPDHDYVLQLDFTNVRSGEDAGSNAVIEILFRTGKSNADRIAVPKLGAYSASEPLRTVGGSCPDVLLAQTCRDTGPNTLHSFESLGANPLAWLVGDQVEPARCEAPQVFTHVHARGGECFAVRAIGPGGLASDPTTACIPLDQSRDPDAGATTSAHDASPDSRPETSVPSGAMRNDSGCSVSAGSSRIDFLALLLALLFRRHSRYRTRRAAASASTICSCALGMLVGCGDASNLHESALTVASLRRSTCPSNPAFTCSDDAVWSDREARLFGHDDHPVGEDGCMKVACASANDCAAGSECYRPACYPLNVSCDDTSEGGRTQCECSADPACGGAYCRPR